MKYTHIIKSKEIYENFFPSLKRLGFFLHVASYHLLMGKGNSAVSFFSVSCFWTNLIIISLVFHSKVKHS